MGQNKFALSGSSGETSERIFSNKYLEFLTKTHIAIPVTLYFTLSAVLLFTAISYAQLPGWLVAILFMAGLVFFTLVEYLMHRFFYHYQAKTEKGRNIIYTIHGVHHKQPKDKSRLSLPPVLSILIAALWFGIFYLLITTYTYGFMPGFMTGYAGYLLVHYIVHIYHPPNNFFRFIWRNHAIHHYKDDTVLYGVSSPLWDYVFGTTYSHKKQLSDVN